jgi:hypothetical protein
MSETIQGSCLCGEVKFEVSGPFRAFYLCHCSRCQKASGSAHASNIFGPASALTWISGECNISHFKLPDAQFFGTHFCKTCGCPTPIKNDEMDMAMIPAGALESEPGKAPDFNIQWDSRAAWEDSGRAAECLAQMPTK